MDTKKISYDLQHNLRGPWICIREFSRRDDLTLTQQMFEEEVANAKGAIERFLVLEQVDGIPDQQTLRQYQDVFRNQYERLQNLKYPSDINETIGILESLTTIILHP